MLRLWHLEEAIWKPIVLQSWFLKLSSFILLAPWFRWDEISDNWKWLIGLRGTSLYNRQEKKNCCLFHRELQKKCDEFSIWRRTYKLFNGQKIDYLIQFFTGPTSIRSMIVRSTRTVLVDIYIHTYLQLRRLFWGSSNC